MANQYVNKMVVNGTTKFDLTGDTVTESDVLTGKTFHDRTGATKTGTCDYDANTSDATALASEILSGKTAYSVGSKITGTMPNRGKVTGTISTKDGVYNIAQGYHDGSGTAGISDTEKAKLVPANIRQGITILGVEGTMSGSESEKPQAQRVTPTFSQQVVLPDADFTCLSQVTVEAIPISEQDNPQGGITLIIG